jgi:hypothetical protein
MIKPRVASFADVAHERVLGCCYRVLIWAGQLCKVAITDKNRIGVHVEVFGLWRNMNCQKVDVFDFASGIWGPRVSRITSLGIWLAPNYFWFSLAVRHLGTGFVGCLSFCALSLLMYTTLRTLSYRALKAAGLSI